MSCYCGDCQKCGHRCSKCDQRYPGQFPNDYPSCDCNTRASTPPTPQAEFATCSSAELFQALGKSAAEAETMERGLNAVIRRADMKPVAPKAEGGVGKAVKWICACLDVVDYTAIGRSKELLNVLTAATECQFNAERARALQEQVLSDYDVIDQLRLELAKSKEQWRPIADAPRDGTWILVYDRECDIPCPVFWCDDRWCYGTGAYETFHDPKEWLPLPPPPAIPSEPNCGRVECICGRCK